MFDVIVKAPPRDWTSWMQTAQYNPFLQYKSAAIVIDFDCFMEWMNSLYFFTQKMQWEVFQCSCSPVSLYLNRGQYQLFCEVLSAEVRRQRPGEGVDPELLARPLHRSAAELRQVEKVGPPPQHRLHNSQISNAVFLPILHFSRFSFSQ